MFPKLDQHFVSELAENPSSFLTVLNEFQLANFVAAKQIADNNIDAYRALATVTDPQEFARQQSEVLKATYERNLEVVKKLWQSFGVSVP